MWDEGYDPMDDPFFWFMTGCLIVVLIIIIFAPFIGGAS